MPNACMSRTIRLGMVSSVLAEAMWWAVFNQILMTARSLPMADTLHHWLARKVLPERELGEYNIRFDMRFVPSRLFHASIPRATAGDIHEGLPFQPVQAAGKPEPHAALAVLIDGIASETEVRTRWLHLGE